MKFSKAFINSREAVIRQVKIGTHMYQLSIKDKETLVMCPGRFAWKPLAEIDDSYVANEINYFLRVNS